MSTCGKVKIWVKIEDGKLRERNYVRVEANSDIAEVVECALEKEKVDIAPSLVSVESKSGVVRRDQIISSIETSYDYPLILHCRDVGTHAI